MKLEILNFSCICQPEPVFSKDLKKHLLIDAAHTIKPIFSKRIESKIFDYQLASQSAIFDSKILILFVIRRIVSLLTLKSLTNILKILNYLDQIKIPFSNNFRTKLLKGNQSRIQTSKQKIQACINTRLQNYPYSSTLKNQ